MPRAAKRAADQLSCRSFTIRTALTLGARVYDLSAGETAYGSFMEDSTEWQLRTLEQARAVVPPELTQPVPEG